MDQEGSTVATTPSPASNVDLRRQNDCVIDRTMAVHVRPDSNQLCLHRSSELLQRLAAGRSAGRSGRAVHLKVLLGGLVLLAQLREVLCVLLLLVPQRGLLRLLQLALDAVEGARAVLQVADRRGGVRTQRLPVAVLRQQQRQPELVPLDPVRHRCQPLYERLQDVLDDPCPRPLREGPAGTTECGTS